MSIVSLVIAPTLAKMHPTSSATVKSQTIEMSIISTDTSANAIDTANTVTMSTDSKTLVQALQEDGLAPKDNVKIEVKNGNISVNGKALKPEQNEKYKTYLHTKMAIKE
jgi:K(+)-stimulated pyrophosphate-energized sodium pump